MSRTLRLAPIAAAIAIAIAGCGSGGSTPTNGTSSSQTSAATRAFVAQADPICKQISTQRETANSALKKAGSTGKELQVLAQVAPGVADDEHQAVVRLQAMKAPTSLTADWQRLLAGMSQLADDTTEIAAHAKAKDLKAIESVTASGRTLRQTLTALAAHFGFVYCGRTS